MKHSVHPKWPTNQDKTETKGKHCVGVFDQAVGHFGCSCGPLGTSTWAILDLDYAPFWSFLAKIRITVFIADSIQHNNR